MSWGGRNPHNYLAVGFARTMVTEGLEKEKRLKRKFAFFIKADSQFWERRLRKLKRAVFLSCFYHYLYRKWKYNVKNNPRAQGTYSIVHSLENIDVILVMLVVLASSSSSGWYYYITTAFITQQHDETSVCTRKSW